MTFCFVLLNDYHCLSHCRSYRLFIHPFSKNVKMCFILLKQDTANDNVFTS